MPFRNIQPSAPPVFSDAPPIAPELYEQATNDSPVKWLKAAVVLSIVNLGGLAFLIWEVVSNGMGK